MASRKEKYPDTRTFKFYNANPKGRMTCDCVVRAICTAMDRPYNDVLKEMFEVSIETGYEYTDKKCIEKYLESKGWTKYKQPRKGDNTKYTGKEFCDWIQEDINHDEFCGYDMSYLKRIIANIGGNHIVAIVNGKVNDIWDSTGGCIGNYWVKGNKK